MSLKIDIENTEGRARASTIGVGKKTLDFPRFSVGISHDNNRDVELVKDNFDETFLNEYFMHMTPDKLTTILTEGRKHQAEKDKIRRSLAATDSKQMNMIYLSFREFGGDKIGFDISHDAARSLFSLLDIEGIDIVAIPMSPNFAGTDSMKNMIQTFKTQRADFLDEFALMGTIPYGVPKALFQPLLEYYLKNDILSIGMDFGTFPPVEDQLGLMLNILDKSEKTIHLHGFNVRPRSGSYTKSVQPIYDLLTRVYGFDSFGSMRFALGGAQWKNLNLSRRTFKADNVRMRVPETYGDYNKLAIFQHMSDEGWSCKCPSCRKEKVADMYDIQMTAESYEDLRQKARTHRIITTHEESKVQRDKIRKGKFEDHLLSKSSIVSEFQNMKMKFA